MQTSVVAQAEVQSPAPIRPKPLPSVAALLFRLILACLLPALLGAGFMVYMEYERGRTQLDEATHLSVRDKLAAVDAQLERAELFAQTLAITRSLNRQDFATFHEGTRRLLRESNLKLSVIVYDASGQQLLNTNTLYGAPLRKRQDIGQIQSVFATGRMVSSTIISRTSDGHSMVGNIVPVFSDQKVAYALAVGFSPETFNNILSLQHLPAGSMTTILDSTGTIAARSHEAEKFVGQQAPSELRKQLEKQTKGSFNITSGINNTFRATYSRSPSSGWAVAIGIPHQSIEEPLSHNLLMFSLGAAILLSLSLGSAWIVGKRIAKSMRSLQAAAVALGSANMVDIPVASLVEADELSQAIQASARLLKRRTQQLLIANETLQERSAELTEAQHIARTGNWKWHASTGAFFASEELLRLYGRKILLPFAEQYGKVFPAEAWQELKTAAKATQQTKTGFSLLLPTLTKDGTQLWTRVNGEIVCNATGEVTGLRGTLQDVDGDVKADIALQDSTKRYRTLFEGSPDAIVVHINGTVAFANMAALKLFAVAAEPDLIGKSLSKFVHPDFQRFVMTRLLTANQLGKSAPPFELKLITVTGQTFMAQVRSAELTFEGKHFIQTYIQDLTERKRHETEIARLQTEMHDILAWQVAQHTVAALAHEVNQPLASAAMLCEAANRMLLQTDGLSSDIKADKSMRLNQTLQRIASDIERAGGVLKNLLQSVNQPDITQAPEMVNEMLAESLETALEEGVFNYPIVTDYAVDLPVVKVNRLQLTKVILNLIHNAAQAMHAAQVSGGKIWVSTALVANGREICISVRDQGPGVSTALQQEIFQPFITTKPHGMGMGLTLSRALIEANGGKLWHSQDADVGATFHFTLPISS